MDELWTRMVAWLTANAPAIGKKLHVVHHPEVRKADLLRLERALGVTLLDEFKDFYAKYNGQKQGADALFDGAHWLSLSQSLEVWHEQREEGWNAYWVPLAHDEGDDSFLCHDLQPPPGEPVGQVIRVSKYSSDEYEVVARSLTQWFEAWVTAAEAGGLQLIPKRGVVRRA